MKVNLSIGNTPLLPNNLLLHFLLDDYKNHFDQVNQIVETFERKGITLSKVIQNKKTIAPILENYSNKVDYQGGTKKFIREVIQKLPKQ